MDNGSQLSVTSGIEGKEASYRSNGLTFPVRLLDARRVWGRVDVLISPIGGKGEKWVEASTLTMKE